MRREAGRRVPGTQPRGRKSCIHGVFAFQAYLRMSEMNGARASSEGKEGLMRPEG